MDTKFLSHLPSHEPAQESAAIVQAPPVTVGHKPTLQQSAFLSALLDTADNILLQARAGTGKTSSILMGVDAYVAHYPSHEILVCAFSTSIKDEVAGKLRARGYDWQQVGCQTVHSMGMGLLKYVFRPEVDERKVWKLIKARQDNGEPLISPFWIYPAQINALVAMAKQSAVGFFPDLPIDSADVWQELADHYDIDFDGTCDIRQVIACAQETYRQSLQITSTVDYNDMVLFPLIKNMRVRYTKDLILGDEVQDWSRARQALVRKFMRPGNGRLVAVGDDRQAIYGFAGADSAAMENLQSSLSMRVLPLSVTWRCPKAVVALANRFVPDLEAAPSAPEGEVLKLRELTTRNEWANTGGSVIGSDLASLMPPAIFLDDLIPSHDAILCRNTAPLISYAYKLIRAGVPAKVEGRKIGDGLRALCERWKSRSTAELLLRLADYRERESQNFRAKDRESHAQEIEDRVDTLREIIAEVNRRGHKDIASLVKFIKDLFEDGAKECVILATYHRAKGREWERVFLIEHGSRCPSRAARQKWQREQENHLAYVALTRTKHTLVFVG
jgi:superfamily I DNA/RNA helicase